MDMVKDLIKKDSFARYIQANDNTILLFLNEKETDDKEYYLCDVIDIQGYGIDAVKKWLFSAVIGKYDSSENVNSFYVNDIQMWRSKSDRNNLVAAINSWKNSHDTYRFDDRDNGISLDLNCDSFLAMLHNVEEYAIKCYNVTSEHIANVKALDSVEDIINYDYKQNYPDKLLFYIKGEYVYLDGKKLVANGEIADSYDPSHEYKQDEYCTYLGKCYKFKLTQGVGIAPTDETYWVNVPVAEELNRLQTEINNLKI